MKKLTKEQFDKLVQTNAKKNIFRTLDNIEVNEGAFISNTEWEFKSEPSTLIRQSVKGKRFSIIKLKHGFAILRTE